MKDKWIIFWDRGMSSRLLCDRPKQVVKETEKLIKFSRSGSWPRQIEKTDFLASYDSEEAATEALNRAKTAYKSAYVSFEAGVQEARAKVDGILAARKSAVLDAVAEAVS